MRYPILLPNIFDHPFTYESDFELKIGDYVKVPFGKSNATGVVWDEFEKNNKKNFKIKKILMAWFMVLAISTDVFCEQVLCICMLTRPHAQHD